MAIVQGMTAHYLVHSTGRVKPGDKVLVHTAAGGTGSLVCQMAKNAGNTVNPLLSPPGGLFFSSTVERGLNREGGGLFNLAKCVNGRIRLLENGSNLWLLGAVLLFLTVRKW